ncbi:MAG: 30S ribosomal protein S15 [Candidatus Marsarchaeota archaeon]|jgi:small subunit ribosomal protein S15|nr:30S ribosomal protein S15 [Candidatus Marsarchaeota archaeon]
MARIYGKHYGKAKSRKPYVAEFGVIPKDANITKEAIEDIIVNYAKSGKSPAMIGELLKKQHNVPYIRQYTGKRLSQILEEKGLKSEIPADLLDLMKKAVNMRKHLAANKQDKHNTLRLKRTESKIWRLVRYYTKNGYLPEDWKYNPELAALIIKGSA